MTNLTLTDQQRAILDVAAARMAPMIESGMEFWEAFEAAMLAEQDLCREMAAAQTERSKLARRAIAMQCYRNVRVSSENAAHRQRVAGLLNEAAH